MNKNEIKKLRDNIITNINPKYCVIFTKNNVTEIFSLNVLENVGIFTNYCPSIQTGISYNEDLIDFYSENIQKSKIMQDELINNLKVLIPHIEGLEISTNIIPKKTTIMLRLKGLDSLMPVSLLGEGTIRLFRILLEIVICKNNRLMIDDIDSGIYFNRHIDYWRTIIRFAKLYNVQIFASTHSLECMKYFADALKSEDMEDYREKARIHSLIELPNGSVKSFTYKYDQFKYSLDMEHEIRG